MEERSARRRGLAWRTLFRLRCIFFFQAEDGIRDLTVTGVQTCALPISIPANATNTLALWVGTTASGGAYPQKLDISRRVMIPLVMASMVGGLAGAFLLIRAPAQNFLSIFSLLLPCGTLLVALRQPLNRRPFPRLSP